MNLNRFHFKIAFYSLMVILLGIIAFSGSKDILALDQQQPGEGVELTVYNQDLALVKDRRMMELPIGMGELRFTDVAALIDPTSVWFRSLTEPKVRVLEQNYEYDVISDTKLLQNIWGKKSGWLQSKVKIMKVFW